MEDEDMSDYSRLGTLPDEAQFAEPENYHEMVDGRDLTVLHKSYRKQDRPLFKNKDVVNTSLLEKVPAIIHIRDEKGLWFMGGDNTQNTFGSIIAETESKTTEQPMEIEASPNEPSSPGSLRKDYVHLRTSADTQYPSFCIIIVRDDGSEVQYTIFAKDIGKDNAGQYGVKFLSGTDEDMGKHIPMDAEVQGLWNSQSSWETRIILYGRDVRKRATWTNLSSKTLRDI
ncbi:hypothetical protein LTS18_004762 [Coniosporium uncinatum]|uniref:Uncharacterized protein n=1 Tax=Coniosporium uncinatum TaxID=93489 RepID=A0ACC3DYD8_9PEZI|nr:hypothetical protein LTS18_004762 [Coniosporium uncinatum]